MIASLFVALAVLAASCGSSDEADTTTAVAPAASTTAAAVVTTTAAPAVTAAPADTASPGRTFASADGVETTVTDVSRIVSLNGDLTEIIFELGLGSNVVGVDVTTTFPPEAAALNDQGETVGFAQSLAAEAVLRFDPSLVIGDQQVGPPEAIEQLRAAGVPVIILEATTTLDGVAPKILRVADILDLPGEGATLAARVSAEIDAARALAAGAETELKVAYIYTRGPQVLLLFGAGTPTQAMIEGAGATDAGAAAGVFGPAPLTPEALLAASPDVIVLPEAGLAALGGLDVLLTLPGVADTPAGQNGAFLAYDEAYFFNMGPRAGMALDEFVRALYPGIGG